MFKRFFTVAAVAMLFAACQVVEVEVESITGQDSGAVTIGAIYEPLESFGTKSDITIDNNNHGVFTWSNEDAIWVNSSYGYWNKMLINDGTGGATASFYASYFIGAPTCPAVFPAIDRNNYTNRPEYEAGVLTIKLPSLIEWSGSVDNDNHVATMQADNIMVAEDFSEGKLAFKNVGGLFRLDIRNVPVGAQKLVFTANKKINGDFTVGHVEEPDANKVNVTYPVINTPDPNEEVLEAEKTVTIDFTSAIRTARTDMIFYIPVPVGSYQISTLALKNGSDVTFFEIHSSANNTVNRRKLINMPPIALDVNINADIENDPNYIITTPVEANGVVNLYNTDHDMIVQMNRTSGDVTIAYSEEENAKEPENVYITVLDNSTVNSLNINLPNSTVYVNGYEGSSLGSVSSVTAANTLKVLFSPLTIGTATINQGNVDIEGKVNAVVVAAGATSDGQTACESNKIQVSVSSEAAVQTITLNAATDVIVEQPKDNIVAENTENKVYVIVNAENSSATAKNEGEIYVTANANCSVTATGEDATVFLENNGAVVTRSEEHEDQITTGIIERVQIGSDVYSSLVEAIAKVKPGETITLIADLDFSQAPYANYEWSLTEYKPLELCVNDVTLDLNGHTISNMGNSAIAIGHLLAANGRISNLTVKNGTLLAGKTNNVTNSYVLLIAGVDGITIKNVTTNGGINVCSGSTNVVIEDCTINGTKYYTVCSQTGSEVTIKGTTYTKNTDPSVANKSMFWIQGADSDSDMVTPSNPTGSFGASSITIENGTYTVDLTNGGAFYYTKGLAPSLKGGSYNFDPSDYCAPGFVASGSGTTWTVAAAPTTWDGSSKADLTMVDADTYSISNAAQLAQFAYDVNNGTSYAGKTVKLEADINLDSKAWTPIGLGGNSASTDLGSETGCFLGTFDGQNHTISNLNATHNNGDRSFAALFGNITVTTAKSVVIKNVTVSNVNINSEHMAAGILARYYGNNSGASLTIEGCSVSGGTITSVPFTSGAVKESGNQAGGIVGNAYATGVNIKDCSVSGVTIQGTRDLGGIAGSMTDGAVEFSGNTVSNTTINQVFPVNIEPGKDMTTVHEIVGRTKSGWSVPSGNTASSVTVNLQADKWDGNTKVALTQDTKNADLYYIYTAAQLAQLAYDVNHNDNNYAGKTVKLMNNIDLNNKAWTPIGLGGNSADDDKKSETGCFLGTFDGQNHTISNLTATHNNDDRSFAGLFGNITLYSDKSVVIKNVTVSNVNINSEHMAAGILARYYGNNSGASLTIDHCSVSGGTITSVPFTNGEIKESGNQAGGIVGNAYATGVNIKDCSVSGVTIQGTRDLGGIAGSMTDGAVVFSNNSVSNTTINQVFPVNIEPGKDMTTVHEIVGRTKSGWSVPSGNTATNVTVNLQADKWDGNTKVALSVKDGVYYIYTAAQLAQLAYDVNHNDNNYAGKTVKLMNNIDLNNKAWTPIGLGGNNADDDKGSETGCFLGTFDGNHKTISNLTVEQMTNEDRAFAGLFGNITLISGTVTIKDLAVQTINIRSNHMAAGILGRYYGTSTSSHLVISGCSVNSGIVISLPFYNSISKKYESGNQAAGIVGNAYGKGITITNCAASDLVIYAARDIAGIAGNLESTGVSAFSNNSVADINIIRLITEGYEKEEGSSSLNTLGQIVGRGGYTPDSTNTYQNVSLDTTEEYDPEEGFTVGQGPTIVVEEEEEEV